MACMLMSLLLLSQGRNYPLESARTLWFLSPAFKVSKDGGSEERFKLQWVLTSTTCQFIIFKKRKQSSFPKALFPTLKYQWYSQLGCDIFCMHKRKTCMIFWRCRENIRNTCMQGWLFNAKIFTKLCSTLYAPISSHYALKNALCLETYV